MVCATSGIKGRQSPCHTFLGADNAIHQKTTTLLRKYEKDLVAGIIRRDSLNALHAYQIHPVQPFTCAPSPVTTVHPFGTFGGIPPTHQPNHLQAPYPVPSHGGPPMAAFAQPPSYSHPLPTTTRFPVTSATSSLVTQPIKNNRGGKGVKRRCRTCKEFVGLCTCPNLRAI